MATRNRTNIFMQHRNTIAKTHRAKPFEREDARASFMKNMPSDVERGLVSDHDSSLPPAWIDVVDAVHDDVARITTKLDELQRQHRQHLMPQFGDTDDTEQTIEIITQEITRLFRSAEQKVKKVQQSGEGQSLSSVDVKNPQSPKASVGEDAVKKNVTRQLAMELSTLSQSFRKSQQEYLQRLRRQKEGLPNYEEKGGGAGGSVAPVATLEEFDQGFTTQQLLALEHSETAIDERDRELRNIAASINDLAVIFKELSVLVIDQGTILDRIDYNVEQLVQHTEKGYQELKKAEDYQKSARMKLCIILLTVLVIGFGLALFFKKAVAKK